MGIKRIFVGSNKVEDVKIPKVAPGEIPLVLDDDLRSRLEAALGHKITSLSDYEECIKKGIIRDAPEITRELMKSISEEYENEDGDDEWIL